MNLESGTRLGPYRIESVLGAGGMGVVYRAQDTRLGRSVAIKVLPAALTANADARARLENEARAVAALSHPHICAIYDMGRADDGIEYLVMEYLEGKTLASCIERGPLPLKDVLRYGEEIADALHSAHRAGITHRDLKPGNIMITAGGAKLLDFGLAKTLGRGIGSSDDSATLVQSPPLTEEGTILGTVQYMSPEQIENRTVDHRSDIFALGVVLYEMATGRRPFAGSSPMSIVSSILSDDPPPVSSLQPAVPRELERIITTALEKNPDERWHTAHDVARQLRWLRDSTGSMKASPPPSRNLLTKTAIGYLLVAGVAFAAGFVTLHLARSSAGVSRTIRLHLPLTESATISEGRLRQGSRASDVPSFAVSPDGNAICFVTEGKGGIALYVRQLDSFDARRIDGSEGASGPFWSDDGKWIAFSANRKLWRVKASGEAPPSALCDVAVGGASGSWRGDTILFSDAPAGRAGVFRLPASGGEPKPVIVPSAEEWRQSMPYLLPDEKHFLYITAASGAVSRSLCFASMEGGVRRVLLQNVSQGRVGRDGKLLYVKDGKLLAQTFDQSTGVLSGEPETVVDGVSFFLATATAAFDTNESGILAYQTNSRVDRLSLIDRSGTEKKLLDDADKLYDLGVSPDGRTAAVTILNRGNGMGDIWLYDLARGTREPFTNEVSMDFSPVFSSDGRSIYYGCADRKMPHVVRRSLGSSTVESVTEDGRFRFPGSMTGDGSVLFFLERNPASAIDILQLSLRTHEIRPVHATAAVERDPAVSPDGRYLAYAANTSGGMEVYIQDLKASDSSPSRLTNNGGVLPRWRGDGAELYLLSLDRKTISVARAAEGSWQDATVTPLFNTTDPVLDFKPLPGGETFAVLQSGSEEDDAALHVVVTR